MDLRFLSLERTDGVIRLVFDRPPVNVLHIDMLREAREAVAVVAADPEAKVLLLRGAGKAFCAGVDVADHATDRVDEMIDEFHGFLLELLELEVPVVAAVHGMALGGGCEVVLAADVVLARAGATFGQPEIRLGVFPPVAAALLPRLVGRQRALDLILSGRTVDTLEARELGLVSRVFPADEFDTRVEEYVETLSGHSRPVLRLTKRAVLEGLELPLREALRREEDLYLDELMGLEDPHEGLAAFMEKREPVWRDA